MGRVVAAAVYSAGKKVTNITLDEGSAWAAKPGHFVWIGLEEPSAVELTNLQRQFNLHELAIEDAMEKLQYDLFYIKNQSLPFDLSILFTTIKTVVLRKGT